MFVLLLKPEENTEQIPCVRQHFPIYTPADQYKGFTGSQILVYVWNLYSATCDVKFKSIDTACCYFIPSHWKICGEKRKKLYI